MRLEGYFKLKENNTTLKIETIAGATTFMTMAYIIFVNPSILSETGMNFEAVALATILAAAIGCLLRSLFAPNLPFAVAPGMGLNAFFAYTVCIGMGFSWQVALGAVFLDGLIFLIICLLPIRDRLIQDIPQTIKLSTGVGIGLFIAFTGLANTGVIVRSETMLIGLGNILKPEVLMTLIGLLIMALLMSKRIKGSLLWGIILTAMLTWIFGFSTAPKGISDIAALPNFSALSNTFAQMDVLGALSYGLLTVIFTFTFVDIFDTVGTMMGLASKLGIIDKKGGFKNAGRCLLSDAIATMIGAVFGTSTVTTYVESAAGVAEGGKTGFATLVTGFLFLIALFLVPLTKIIPVCATAPALIMVGLIMMTPILEINFHDITEGLPAFLTIIMMPLTYSIANGLMIGIIAYTLIKSLSGKWKEVSITMWVLSVLFIFKFIYPFF